MKQSWLAVLLAAQMGVAMATESAAWNPAYGGVDKHYDHALLAERDALAAKFQTLLFKDGQNGVEMAYNLFVPEGYHTDDKEKKYPLLMFVADSSTTGKGVAAPLMQGWGGIIWASEAVQREHPLFVLVPATQGPEKVVTDAWETSPEVDTMLRLLQHTVASYPIDEDRIYATGQSMGGMISFYLNSRYPDLFAASMFVGSQWDVNVLEPLTQTRFIYTVSAGDPKASVGMREVQAMFADKGVAYGDVAFSARLPQAEQDAAVATMLAEKHAANFIRFDVGTVLPDLESARNHKGGEHMYSFDYAYLLKPARDWLLNQRKP